MGPPVEVSGTGGCGHPHVNNFYLSVVQVADDMAGGRGLALTSTRYDYYRGGIGGGGYICHPPHKNRRTVHINHNHHGSLYGGRAAPWGACVPAVVGTGDPGTGGDTVGGKGGGNVREGEEGGWG